LVRGSRFIRATDLSRIIFKDEAREYESAPLVIVDDLGVEFLSASGAFQSFFDGLIDARYSNALRTIVTSNLGAPELEGRYGRRFVDRWRECGWVVELNGKSMRKPGGSK
jgi:DNA replication protein DnaC